MAGAELFAETMGDGIRSLSADPVKLREEEGQLDGRGLDVADVGVVERGGCFGFALEALADFLVGDEMSRKKLQGDGTVELRVLGFVDDTHAAFTELLGDLVVRDGLADQDTPILARFK